MGTRGKTFREQIAPGAFAKALDEKRDVVFLVNHDPNLVLGRTGNGTLNLAEDERGLVVEGDFPDTSYARDLATLIERRDVSQMSFGFRVREDKWERRGLENVRTLVDVDLLDVSAVTFPAYEETNAEVEERMLATALREVREGKQISSKNRASILAVIETLSALVGEPEVEANSLYNYRQRLREREL